MSHTAQEAICPLPEGDFFAQFDCPRASTIIRRGVSPPFVNSFLRMFNPLIDANADATTQ
jgi:hypothetical protein